MDNRYKQAFAKLDESGAFVPFTILGWPDRPQCLRTIKLMIDRGASALELGIAFSDPVADGEVIQRAAFETLDAAFHVSDAWALVTEVRQYDRNIPIGILTYLNIVLAQGAAPFFLAASQAGVDSVLIADLPPDAAVEVQAQADAHGIALVFIITPLTTDERLRTIASLSKAYLYVVSRLGITGPAEHHDHRLEDLLRRAKAATALPLLVGFGISSPASARDMMTKGAHGVITGSKIIEIIRNDQPPDYPQLQAFLSDMRAALCI